MPRKGVATEKGRDAVQQLFPEQRPVADPLAIYDAITWPVREDRPYIALNMVSSIDGRTTVAGGHSERLGSDLDHALMRRIRAHADVVLCGAETVRSTPVYPGVGPDEVELRRRRGLSDQPRAAVLSTSLALPWTRRFGTDAPLPPIVFTCEAAPRERLAEAERHAEVHVVGRASVDIAAVVTILHRDYGAARILAEGGPRLNGLLLEAGLIDELFWTIAPKLAGGAEDLSMIAGAPQLSLPRYRLLSIFEHDSELFLRYRRA